MIWDQLLAPLVKKKKRKGKRFLLGRRPAAGRKIRSHQAKGGRKGGEKKTAWFCRPADASNWCHAPEEKEKKKGEKIARA